jgi:hypothetical protein
MRLLCIAIACLLAGCNETDAAAEVTMNDKHPVIRIEMQQPIQQLLAKSPVPFEKDCLEQANTCVYEHDRRTGDPNLPSVDLGDLQLEQVTSVTIFNDETQGQDIQHLKLILRSVPSNSPHEDYRRFAYTLIDQIKQAGWQHYYFPSDPRIPGDQADKVMPPGREAGTLSHAWFDPNYQMDLERWLEVDSFYRWYFHKDGVYLQMDAWRNDSREAPQERGTYLFSLTLQTASNFWRAGLPEEQRDRWIEFLPAELERAQQQRELAEAKASNTGIAIDHDYRDPPVAELQ